MLSQRELLTALSHIRHDLAAEASIDEERVSMLPGDLHARLRHSLAQRCAQAQAALADAQSYDAVSQARRDASDALRAARTLGVWHHAYVTFGRRAAAS